MDTPKLIVNGKCVGLRLTADNTFAPKNIKVLATAIDAAVPIEKPLTVITYFQNNSNTVCRTLQDIEKRMGGENWNLVIVDNGSVDDTYMLIKDHISSAANFVCVQIPRTTNRDKFIRLCRSHASPVIGDRTFVNFIHNDSVKFEGHTVKSFCCVGTHEVKKEIALLIYSIRCFHSEPIYVICDDETKRYIKYKFDCSHIFFDVSANKNQLDHLKTKHKKQFKILDNNLHRLDCILLKMRAIEIALKNQQNTLFVDSDIIFSAKVDCGLYSDIVLSPHYRAQASQCGIYNAGYIFVADKHLPDTWRDLFLNESNYCEQECMTKFNNIFNTDIFDERHNVGFWRPLTERCSDVVSFHSHLFGQPGDRQDPTLGKQQLHAQSVTDYFNKSSISEHEDILQTINNLRDENEDAEIKLVEVEGKYLTTSWAHSYMGTPIMSNDKGKLKLIDPTVFQSHRSGWSYAIESLVPLHNDTGTLFDGFLENQFGWTDSRKRYSYNEPWMGVFHNPQNIPNWFFNEYSVENITQSEHFRDSINNCKGIFTLSEYHADHVRGLLDVPVESLIHPTEIPSRLFSFDEFNKNNDKKVINIGYWLRKLTSIYQLPLNSYYTKCRLMPYSASGPKKIISDLFNIEMERGDIKLNEYFDTTVTLDRVSNVEYDNLLSKNIVFLDLYDSSANNAVIECIARGTPLLINPIPAVVEYLGSEYPFYFNSLEEAAVKAVNFNLIKQTHQYLIDCDIRKKLSREYFRDSVINSDIYQSL